MYGIIFRTVLILPILIVTNCLLCQAQDCVLHLATREDAWDKVIHRNLQKHYNPFISPNNNTCVTISVYFMLKSFSLDEIEGKFTAKLWNRLKWRDERLTWSPEDYGGVDKIVMASSNIWVPKLKLLNNIIDEQYSYYEEFKDCIVSNDGGILCVPEMVYESFCNAKLRNWPYDIQNCTLELGTGEYDYGFGTLNLTQGNRTISLIEAEYGTGWNIMQLHTKINESSVVQLSMTLTIERQAYGLVVILVFPCIIVSLMTLTAAFLSVTNTIRLGMLCFSLISHFIVLRGIVMFLPLHTVDTPVILLFIRGSILLTVASILFFYLLKAIMNGKMMPSEWASSVSDKVFSGPGKHLIFPKWEPKMNEEVNVKEEVWTNIANILNSFFMLIVAISYIALFSVYMPKQPPYVYPESEW